MVDENMSLRYWHRARWELQQTENGRSALKHIEDNHKGTDFLLYYKDISSLAKAYVGELSEFIDVAQEEKKRILSKTSLL